MSTVQPPILLRKVTISLRTILVTLGMSVGFVILIGLLWPATQAARRAERNGRNFMQGSPGSVISADAYDFDTPSFAAQAASPPVSGKLRQATGFGQATGASGAEASAIQVAEAPQKATANRKIIYDVNVDLVTEDLGKLEAGLLRLIEVQRAYVADSDRSGATGSVRRGHWKVRVPVDGYEVFVRGVLGLGELVSTKSQSQDVSAEYYDLDARQNAKKVEETRLLKHLSDSTGRLDEILAVERELARVRGEIEQMQGRLAVLSNLATLATVTVTASEIKDYVPPQAPTLAQRVSRTFAGSLTALRELGEEVLIGTVALLPWLVVLIPLGVLGWLWWRRAAARRVVAPAPSGGLGAGAG